MEKDNGYIFSVILLGTSAVGKSSIAFYLEHGYPPPRDIKPTIAFGISHVVINDLAVISLVDVGGQKRFLDMRYHERFVRNADGLISVVDSSRRDFYQDEEWLNEALNLINKDVPILAIANKQDIYNVLSPKFVDEQFFSQKLEGRKYKIYGTVANDPGGIRSGENIFQAIRWLINEMKSYKSLSKTEMLL